MGLLERFLDLIFPPKCAFCHRLLDSGSVCSECEKALPRVPEAGMALKLPFISGCVAPLYYEGRVRESLLRYKFGQCTGYAAVYAPLVAKCVRDNLGDGIDVITWAPLSRSRLRRRGYDQARLIAEETAKLLGIEARPLLRKIRAAKPQSTVGSAEKRRANIAGAYAAAAADYTAGKRILIIDDIVTTGSTLSECARMLGMAGAGRIFAAAVARRRD